jgi:hypothetical protein
MKLLDIYSKIRIEDLLLPSNHLFGDTSYVNEIIEKRKVRKIFIKHPFNEEWQNKYLAKYGIKKTLPKNIFIASGDYIVSSGEIGLDFSYPATLRQILSTKPKTLFKTDPLADMVKFAKQIQKITGAKSIGYAGTLPRILVDRKILKQSEIEEGREVTALAVLSVIEDIISIEELSCPHVIIIGGKGNIGSLVVEKILKKLPELGISSLDINTKGSFGKIISVLRKLKKDLIIVNIASENALREYVGSITEEWPIPAKLIFINEAYPHPKGETIWQAKKLKLPIYQVIGGDGVCNPPLDYPYSLLCSEGKSLIWKGIPCCALFLQENGELGKILSCKL